MKKLESSLKNMLLVLTGVTAISVALLAYVNELTKEPIAQANAKTLSDAVSAVVPGFDNDPIAEKKMQEVNGVQYSVYPATKGGEYIGAAVEAVAMGFGGELKVLVGFDAEGKITTTPCCRMWKLRGWVPRLPTGSRKAIKVTSPA